MIQKLGLMGRFRSGLRVLFGREPILRTGRVRKELPCFRSRLRVCVFQSTSKSTVCHCLRARSERDLASWAVFVRDSLGVIRLMIRLCIMKYGMNLTRK